MEEADETGSAFADPDNTDDGSHNDYEVCTQQDPQDDVAVVEVVQEELRVEVAEDRHAGHTQSDDEDDYSAETGEAFHAR